MKILHIIPTLQKGGAERLALDTVKHLQQLPNTEARLVTFHDTNEYPFLAKEVQLEIIPSQYIPSIKGKPQVQVSDLKKYIQDFRPDIIHTHLFEAEMTTRMALQEIAQKYTPKATFTHFHDNMHQLQPLTFSRMGNKQAWTDAYERWWILREYKRYNSHFIGISQHAYDYARKVLRSFPNNNFHLLHNAIDLERFQPESTEAVFVQNEQEVHLVTVGSLNSNKSQSLIIDSLAILHNQGRPFHLDVLGDGPERVNLLSQSKALKLDKYVQFHGKVDHPEKFLQKGQLYVHAAKSEAMGLVLVEAMACGLPVVATDGGGNRDIMQDGKNGVLVKNRDPQEFADAILTLLNNKDVYQETSQNALAYSRQFDIREYVKKLMAIYEKAIEV